MKNISNSKQNKNIEDEVIKRLSTYDAKEFYRKILFSALILLICGIPSLLLINEGENPLKFIFDNDLIGNALLFLFLIGIPYLISDYLKKYLPEEDEKIIKLKIRNKIKREIFNNKLNNKKSINNKKTKTQEIF